MCAFRRAISRRYLGVPDVLHGGEPLSAMPSAAGSRSASVAQPRAPSRFAVIDRLTRIPPQLASASAQRQSVQPVSATSSIVVPSSSVSGFNASGGEWRLGTEVLDTVLSARRQFDLKLKGDLQTLAKSMRRPLVELVGFDPSAAADDTIVFAVSDWFCGGFHSDLLKTAMTFGRRRLRLWI